LAIEDALTGVESARAAGCAVLAVPSLADRAAYRGDRTTVLASLLDVHLERFGLPPDRMGDLVVVSSRHVVIGTSESRHDLSGLDAPLRSHGGLSEQEVPLLVNRAACTLPGNARPRNFDIFDLLLNHAS
jgi:phosphonoacetate hydrolase